MATYNEVRKAYKILRKYNNKVSLLHCVSAYPANPVSCNLKSIDFLRKNLVVL